MIDFGQFPGCREAYAVERTIQVVVSMQGRRQTVRLEALRRAETGRYCVWSYRWTALRLQPGHPQADGPLAGQPQDFEGWVNYDLPWVDEATGDEALSRALRFLMTRCD